jgi:multidrug resistance efflux pump
MSTQPKPVDSDQADREGPDSVPAGTEQAQAAAPEAEADTAPRKMDPVRKWTLIVLALTTLLLLWYLVADRLTPFTSQARVNAYVVPISPEVSGTITEVAVGNNQLVDKGQRLFQIDRSRYGLAVARAEADLEAARQEFGAATAAVESAEASLSTARANFTRSDKDAKRMQQIYEEDPGAISIRRLEIAQADLAGAAGNVAGAEAELERARQQLGQQNEDNARLLAARSALEQSRIDLARTSVVAPDRGLVSDVRVDRGNFAQAGQPLMTFIAIHDVWVQADFTENNLGHVEPGDVVEIALDVQPGRVFKGRVRSVGYGISTSSGSLGALPTIENSRDWLRAAQRFPVIIDFDSSAGIPPGRRVGAQVSVIIYTSDRPFINTLGKLHIRLISLLSYAY